MTAIDSTHSGQVAAQMIVVDVLLALPASASCVRLSLPDGAVVADAMSLAWLRLPQLDTANIDTASFSYGIYGRPVSRSTLLRDGDRIELLRPLLADPMDQRRRRAARR